MFGEASVRYVNGPPHITLAYATTDGDSDLIHQRLDADVAPRVRLTVASVRLVDVLFDEQACQFSWTELATLPLH
ncbi:hypothetical protein D5S17_17520 [Pseudonocardiaceae bacterium YIM PH 21723]|nr:hypothetical protein D5S17_17520 [Pseudonocardiaceae bacterium YIM PH 21723]